MLLLSPTVRHYQSADDHSKCRLSDPTNVSSTSHGAHTCINDQLCEWVRCGRPLFSPSISITLWWLLPRDLSQASDRAWPSGDSEGGHRQEVECSPTRGLHGKGRRNREACLSSRTKTHAHLACRCSYRSLVRLALHSFSDELNSALTP